MAIPKNISKEAIIRAVEYAENNGVPAQNQSAKCSLIENGKRYPPKYIVAVANHLITNEDIDTSSFCELEAKKVLQGLGFEVETKQEKYTLTITKDSVHSTDNEFSMDNLPYGDFFALEDACFKRIGQKDIRRQFGKGERKHSNQVMPRLAMQIFEQSIENLSEQEKINFPVCKYSPNHKIICGIFASIEAFKASRNSYEHLVYNRANGEQFVIYSWNIFATIVFVQECLKRFGNEGDEFVLIYREKDAKENEILPPPPIDVKPPEIIYGGVVNPYSKTLLQSKNIIFRGAPGTGKTYLARKIATDIVSNGCLSDYTSLSEEQKGQIEFVQFHPSYDYTDFVEGLRPTTSESGEIGFKLKDGVFKKFVAKAIKNFEDSQKSIDVIKRELSAKEKITAFFENIALSEDEFTIARGKKFFVEDIEENDIFISIPENAITKSLKLKASNLLKMLESDEKFNQVKDITNFFGKANAQQHYSYYLALLGAINADTRQVKKTEVKKEEIKPYIFIIDEINRGEISKIFGELFFSIDPGYRGKSGEVLTQYANLHEDDEKMFYIPDNVYIIGTMNDIDRSVDSFDFAMRRRFRFIEIKAEDRIEMLEVLGEKKDKTIERMNALNAEISKVEGLNENYHIGASYYLKLSEITPESLWEDYIGPLLQEYVRGMLDESEIMRKFAKAYGYAKVDTGDINDETQD